MNRNQRMQNSDNPCCALLNEMHICINFHNSEIKIASFCRWEIGKAAEECIDLTCSIVTTWQGFRIQIICRVENLKPSSMPNTSVWTRRKRRLPSGSEFFDCQVLMSSRLTYLSPMKSSIIPSVIKMAVSIIFCLCGMKWMHSKPPVPGSVWSTPEYVHSHMWLHAKDPPEDGILEKRTGCSKPLMMLCNDEHGAGVDGASRCVQHHRCSMTALWPDGLCRRLRAMKN